MCGTGLETMTIRIAHCGTEIDKLDTMEEGKEANCRSNFLFSFFSVQLSFTEAFALHRASLLKLDHWQMHV
jgi:hypothetical protein